MSAVSDRPFHYTVGGSLGKDAPSYIVRQADKAFYEATRGGAFSYVFDSRQMGKSSLRVRTMQRLQADGVACAVIDISSVGSYGITADEWYLGIVRRLSRGLGTQLNVLQWWHQNETLSPVERLQFFLENILLKEIPTDIVIFIDEIDNILRLNLKDDFFDLIESFYRRRSSNPKFKRLNFALLGVTTLSDLLRGRNKTLVKLGRVIRLDTFSLQDISVLSSGLVGNSEQPLELLDHIFQWTGGQPFLTQKLCKLISQRPSVIKAGDEKTVVDQVVDSQIIRDWRVQDKPDHLTTIRDRILGSKQRSAQLLKLYKRILEQGKIPANQSSEQQEFLLSGLVREHQGDLYVCCRIHSTVFDLDWIKQTFQDLRSHSSKVSKWKDTGTTDNDGQSNMLKIQQVLNY